MRIIVVGVLIVLSGLAIMEAGTAANLTELFGGYECRALRHFIAWRRFAHSWWCTLTLALLDAQRAARP